MQMNKVLIITYYWPPSGGAGVQRWLKFVKYLRNSGWEPIIYTPENPEVPALDRSLKKDVPNDITVLKTKVWEPYAAYKKFVGRKKDDSIKAGFLAEKKSSSLTEKISVWIRGNYFIPDARKFWIKPSIKYLLNYLKDNPVDAIVSTGPPHSMHMIALGVKQKLNIPWLADFRDPWTNIDFYDKLMLSARSDKKHRKMERSVLLSSDKIVTVSQNWALDFQNLGAKDVTVITNGFDEEDFENIESSPSEKFEIIHIGSLNKDRNPIVLWEALSELINENQKMKEDLRLTLIGQTDYSVFDSLKNYLLDSFANKAEYKPHDELMNIAGTARVLLLPLNKTPNVNGIIPGKLFEYLALKIPILCIGPEDGDSAKIINECKAGIVIDFEDKEKMKRSLQNLYIDFINGETPDKSKDSNRLNFTRRKLTGEMAKLLNAISE